MIDILKKKKGSHIPLASLYDARQADENLQKESLERKADLEQQALLNQELRLRFGQDRCQFHAVAVLPLLKSISKQIEDISSGSMRNVDCHLSDETKGPDQFSMASLKLVWETEEKRRAYKNTLTIESHYLKECGQIVELAVNKVSLRYSTYQPSGLVTDPQEKDYSQNLRKKVLDAPTSPYVPLCEAQNRQLYFRISWYITHFLEVNLDFKDGQVCIKQPRFSFRRS